MKNETQNQLIIGTMRWGSWGKNLSLDETSVLLSQCIENELTTFDLADIYGAYTTEKLFGDALKLSKTSREKITIITKCGIQYPCENSSYKIKAYATSKDYIIEQVEKSLQNIQTDY